MKKVTIVIDGAADRPLAVLGGKTPLEAARTPHLDRLYRRALAGVVRTIPAGLEVGSAVANLSLLGFDPAAYRGRAAVEAAGVGIDVDPDSLFIRVNLVTLEGDSYQTSRMKSYSAYDIETQKAAPLAAILKEQIFTDARFALHYAGSFRLLLEVKGGRERYPLNFAPAHDIIGQPIAGYAAGSGPEKPFFELQRAAYEALRGNPANGVWLWGASIAPKIEGERRGRKLFCETILLKGIARIAGLPVESVPDGTSFPDLLELKCAQALAAAREGCDNLYVHIQECDDLAHERMGERKAAAVESADRMIGALLAGLGDDWSVIVASDHFTFSDTGAHGGDPVPFFLYQPGRIQPHGGRFTERCCLETGRFFTPEELLRAQGEPL